MERVIYVFDDFELDAGRGELRHGGRIVDAEAMAIRLLACLVEHQGSLVTKDELIEAVWEGRALADNAITVCVARLRKVLRRHAGDREFVATVYGQGYRFVRPVNATTRVGRYSTPPVYAGEQEAAPCVGRDRVIERLMRLHESAVDRQGSVVAVMGTGGVGKTRVVEAFERRLGARQRVAWAYCRDSGTEPPLSPWLRLLQTVAVDAWTPELAHALGPHAAQVQAWLGFDDPEPESDAEAKRRRSAPWMRSLAQRASFEAMLQALTLISATTPLCLVLDDVHRADSASLELLHMLLDEIAHTRILLLCTVRQAEGGGVHRPDTHLPAILGHRNCERLPLARLERADIARYLEARLGNSSPDLVDAVLAGSDGIPFFMVELVRQIEANGVPSPAALSVPTAALELFRGRVGSLSEPAQKVLQTAAIIGRAFELSLLQETSDLPPGEVLAAVDEAIAFDIVVAAPGTASAFAFEHELMRRAIYEAMPQAERRALHLQVAGAMEERGIVSDQVTHALAYHLHAALPEGDLAKVAHYCQLAAWAAGAAFANSDAVLHIGHAIEALELKPDSDLTHRANLYLLKAMYSRGQVGCRESLEVARRLGYKLGDAVLLAKAAFMYNPHPSLRPLPGARPLLEHTLTIVSPDDGATRANALACLATTAPGCFDRATTEARILEADALVHTPGNEVSLYPVLLAELHLMGGLAHGERRAELRAELSELARAHPDTLPVLPIDLAIDDALDSAQSGRPAEAEASLERGARIARAINHRELQWHVDRMRAWSTLERGPSVRAVSELGQLHRRAIRNEVVDLALFCAFDRALLALDDRTPPVLDDTDLLALAYDSSDPVHVWAMKVRALSAASLCPEARDALHAVSPQQLTQLPSDAQQIGTLGQLAKAAITLKESAYAEAIAAALEPYPEAFAINIGYRCEGAVSQVLGELAAFQGDRKRAQTRLSEGLARCERAGLVRCAEEAREALSRLASR